MVTRPKCYASMIGGHGINEHPETRSDLRISIVTYATFRPIVLIGGKRP